MLLVCGFDEKKLKEFPSDSFSFHLRRVKTTLRGRSWHFDVVVESGRLS